MAVDNVGLTRGFFQYFVEGNVPDDVKPVLQIIESRAMAAEAAAAWRVRMSDGMFSYSSTCFPRQLEKRFVDDGLSDNNAVIKVTSYLRSQATPTAKPMMAIHDYEVISLTEPVIGHPQAHSGRADDFRGIQNLPPLNNVGNVPGRSAVKRPPTSPIINGPPKRSMNAAAVNGVTSISLITPYINRWRICGVVSCKEDPRDIKTSRGPSKVFSFVVTDQTGSAIKINAFGAEAERFAPLIYNDQAFYVSGGGQSTIRQANKRFNSTGHDYEITLNRECEIQLCNDVHIPAPKMKLHVVPLNRVAEHKDECIDVLAVIDRAEDVVSVIAKASGKQLDRRNIFLVDQSATEVALTLWGEQAVNFDTTHVGEVVGIKGASVREFNGGFSLGAGAGFQMEYNPEGDLTNELYVWHRETKPTIGIATMSGGSGGSEAFERDVRCIGVSQISRMGENADKGVYFNVIAYINNLKNENALYQACPSEGCKKKVVLDNNQYRCDKCNRLYDDFKYVLMLQLELADFTGMAWATVFEEKATQMLGMNAQQLGEIQKADPTEYDAIFQKIRFRTFCFRIRTKFEMYNDTNRQRWDIYDARPVPYDKYLASLRSSLQKLDL